MYSSYNYYGTYPSNYAASSAAVATLGAALMVYMVIIIAIAVIQIIAMWKLYGKAGEKGWKSIIPVYNMVILFKISGLSPWLLFVYLAAIIPFMELPIKYCANAVFSCPKPNTFCLWNSSLLLIFIATSPFYN